MLTIENSLLLVVDFQQRLMPSIHKNEEIERKMEIMIKCCRILNVPIIVTQQYTKGLGGTVDLLSNALAEYEPIEKITFSCYRNAKFRDMLNNTGKANIIVTGIETHICVLQTVMDLLDNGYQAFVVADCIGSRSETDNAYAEKRMEKAGAILTTMESVLFEILARADHPKRKEISALLK